MATPVIMPRQGQSVESCILTEWKVAPGDQVEEGSVLAVIETDKASFDLESPVAGTVLDLFWEADDDVPTTIQFGCTLNRRNPDPNSTVWAWFTSMGLKTLNTDTPVSTAPYIICPNR